MNVVRRSWRAEQLSSNFRQAKRRSTGFAGTDACRLIPPSADTWQSMRVTRPDRRSIMDASSPVNDTASAGIWGFVLGTSGSTRTHVEPSPPNAKYRPSVSSPSPCASNTCASARAPCRCRGSRCLPDWRVRRGLLRSSGTREPSRCETAKRQGFGAPSAYHSRRFGPK